MEPIDPNYNLNISAFNFEQHDLRRQRGYFTLEAIFVAGGVAAAFTLRASPIVRMAAVGCAFSFLCIKKYFWANASEIMLTLDPTINKAIVLTQNHLDEVAGENKQAQRILTFLAVGIIATLGLLFKLQAPKPIKIAAAIVSTVAFAYFFITRPYIELKPPSEELPRDSKQTSTLEGDGLGLVPQHSHSDFIEVQIDPLLPPSPNITQPAHPDGDLSSAALVLSDDGEANIPEMYMSCIEVGESREDTPPPSRNGKDPSLFDDPIDGLQMDRKGPPVLVSTPQVQGDKLAAFTPPQDPPPPSFPIFEENTD